MKSSFNLKKRILLGFSILVGMLAVYGIFYYVKSNSTLNTLNTVVKKDMPELGHVLKVSLKTYELRMQYLALLSATDPVERDEGNTVLEGIEGETQNGLAELEAFIDQDAEQQHHKAFLGAYTTWKEAADQMIEYSNNGSYYEAQTYQQGQEGPAFESLVEEMAKFQDFYGQKQEASLSMISDSIGSSSSTNVTVIMIVIALAIGIAYSMNNSITKPLQILANRLDQGADHTSQAAHQVAKSSQSLASGSSQQAASVEETSASLEEMAAMTKHNTDNAITANDLSDQATEVVDEAFKSMNELIESMHQISTSSEETQKIIKTIDEIAFQTNLLALNAAVEAARAGEAGAGFAVVADEVRNLAMRAAEAARDTAALIDESVQNINLGNQIVERTSHSFTKVAEATGKISELVGEISAGSKEQSQGIEQLNSAVGDIDRIVQNNAATAEESAASSEELSAQSEEMKVAVNELITFIGSTSDAATKVAIAQSFTEKMNAFSQRKQPKERKTFSNDFNSYDTYKSEAQKLKEFEQSFEENEDFVSF